MLQLLIEGRPVHVQTSQDPSGWWTAIDTRRYDGAPDAGRQAIGHGPTEQDAIDALLLELED